MLSVGCLLTDCTLVAFAGEHVMQLRIALPVVALFAVTMYSSCAMARCTGFCKQMVGTLSEDRNAVTRLCRKTKTFLYPTHHELVSTVDI